jgi:cell division transport system permease protein
MIWDEIEFILRETGLQLRRERLIAIATISSVAVLLIVLGAIVLFHLNVRQWTNRVSRELEIWAYFDKDVTRLKAKRLSREVARWPEVTSARFVPKEEGMKKLQAYLPNTEALRGIGNPLPDGVQIRVLEPKMVPDVSQRLADLTEVKDVVPTPEEAAQEGGLVQKLAKMKLIVSWAGGIIAALVAIAGVLIVHNTVRLALHARWREIFIMQLVGGTRGLIAAPFMLEGMIHGIIGSAIACCLLVPAHMYLHALSARAAPFFQLMPDRALIGFVLGALLLGALLGLTGSAISIRRFLARRPGWQT